MPYLPRSKEAALTALETSTSQHLKSQEALQKNVMGTTPEPTSKSERLCKDILLPLGRHRITNGIFSRIGVLGHVQAARVALLNEDLERCQRLELKGQWWDLMDELQWIADNGGEEFYFSIGGYIP
jgi:hypothetical protein